MFSNTVHSKLIWQKVNLKIWQVNVNGRQDGVGRIDMQPDTFLWLLRENIFSYWINNKSKQQLLKWVKAFAIFW